MNIVMASFVAILGQMIEMSPRKKKPRLHESDDATWPPTAWYLSNVTHLFVVYACQELLCTFSEAIIANTGSLKVTANYSVCGGFCEFVDQQANTIDRRVPFNRTYFVFKSKYFLNLK